LEFIANIPGRRITTIKEPCNVKALEECDILKCDDPEFAVELFANHRFLSKCKLVTYKWQGEWRRNILRKICDEAGLKPERDDVTGDECGTAVWISYDVKR
jgi:hypothetical protein